MKPPGGTYPFAIAYLVRRSAISRFMERCHSSFCASVIGAVASGAAPFGAFERLRVLIRAAKDRCLPCSDSSALSISVKRSESAIKRLKRDRSEVRSATARAAIDSNRAKVNSNDITSMGIVITARDHLWITCD